jgi:flagellin FlaB
MSIKKNSQDAFTGLEAAIVLIAFVVVAAVFSYVILGAGFYTTQKAQETVYKGVEQASTNIQMAGNVYGLASNPDDGIDEIRFSINLAPGAPSIDLEKLNIVFFTPTFGPETLTWKSGLTPERDTRYIARIDDTNFTKILTSHNQVEIILYVTPVTVDSRINIEIRPAVGAALPFSRDAPSIITTTNIL